MINANGSIQNVELLRSVNPDLDAEAVRVINAMPKWEPGMQKGKAVSVKYVLPINFRLQGGGADKSKPANSPEFDPQEPPAVIIDGTVMPKTFNIIKAEAIDKINVIKPTDEAHKSELIQKYGEQAKNGVVLITTKR